MLEFIVLGQVPGTQIQITFAWCLLALLIGLILVDVKIHRGHKSTETRAKEVDVIRPGQV